MKYLIACFLLLCSSFVFADTLTVTQPGLTTTITGTYLGTADTEYGPLIQFNAFSIVNTPTGPAASVKKGFGPITPKPLYESWAWEGRFGNRTYDGGGVCYQTLARLGSHNINLVCTEADTYIEEPTCGPNPPCP